MTEKNCPAVVAHDKRRGGRNAYELLSLICGWGSQKTVWLALRRKRGGLAGRTLPFCIGRKKEISEEPKKEQPLAEASCHPGKEKGEGKKSRWSSNAISCA